MLIEGMIIFLSGLCLIYGFKVCYVIRSWIKWHEDLNQLFIRALEKETMFTLTEE